MSHQSNDVLSSNNSSQQQPEQEQQLSECSTWMNYPHTLAQGEAHVPVRSRNVQTQNASMSDMSSQESQQFLIIHQIDPHNIDPESQKIKYQTCPVKKSTPSNSILHCQFNKKTHKSSIAQANKTQNLSNQEQVKPERNSPNIPKIETKNKESPNSSKRSKNPPLSNSLEQKNQWKDKYQRFEEQKTKMIKQKQEVDDQNKRLRSQIQELKKAANNQNLQKEKERKQLSELKQKYSILSEQKQKLETKMIELKTQRQTYKQMNQRLIAMLNPKSRTSSRVSSQVSSLTESEKKKSQKKSNKKSGHEKQQEQTKQFLNSKATKLQTKSLILQYRGQINKSDDIGENKRGPSNRPFKKTDFILNAECNKQSNQIKPQLYQNIDFGKKKQEQGPRRQTQDNVDKSNTLQEDKIQMLKVFQYKYQMSQGQQDREKESINQVQDNLDNSSQITVLNEDNIQYLNSNQEQIVQKEYLIYIKDGEKDNILNSLFKSLKDFPNNLPCLKAKSTNSRQPQDHQIVKIKDSLKTNLKDPHDLLRNMFKQEKKIRQKYFLNNNYMIVSQQQHENKTDTFNLKLEKCKIECVTSFFEHNWTNLIVLTLVECSIDDRQWKEISSKAKDYLPHLKLLIIAGNPQLRNVLQAELNNFGLIRLIYFSTEQIIQYKGVKKCPLSQQSIQQIKKFKEECQRKVEVHY